MADYSPGDVVVCKVGYGRIVTKDSDEFEITQHFDIVCKCDNGYLILVPSSIYLHTSFVMDKRDCIEFNVPDKFVGGTVQFIAKRHVLYLKSKISGLSCARCNEHFDYAEINRIDENGKGILICFLCRNYPYR